MSNPRQNRWARRAAVLLAVLAVSWGTVTTVLWYSNLRDGRARLARAFAELDATDPRWQTIDLEKAHNTSVAPPEANVGSRAMAAIGLLSPEYQLFDSKPSRRSAPLPHLPTKDEISILRAALESTAPAVEMARTVRGLPGGGFRFTYTEPILIGTLLVNTHWTPTIARLLSSDALISAADGRADESLESGLCILHLDRAVGDEPFHVSFLIRCHIQMSGVRSVERTLAWTDSATEPRLAEVQAELGRLSDLPRLRVALRGERAWCYRLLENIEAGAFDPNGWIDGLPPVNTLQLKLRRNRWPGHLAITLELFHRLISVHGRPYSEQKAAYDEVAAAVDALKQDKADAPISTLVGALFPDGRKWLDVDTNAVGLLRSATAAMACERYHRKHNRYPERLTDLSPEFLAAIPTDPFTGNSVRYKRLDDGAVVYVTGSDGTDNGGMLKDGLDSGFDLGFRLFDPAHRRQPPKPKPDQP